MNVFESTLSDALRAEGQEIAMSIDLGESREVLESRLDHIDRRRQGWRIVGGILAAAAVLAVVAFLVLARPAPTAPPATVPAPAVSPTVVLPSRNAAAEAIKGEWTATLTESEARATLAAAGLAAETDTVLADAFGYHGGVTGVPSRASWSLQLYLDSQMGNLYLVGPSGQPVRIDQFVGSVTDGPTLTTTTGVGGGDVEYADYTLFVQGDRMRLGWLRGHATGKASDNEATKRVLYTTSTWMRSTT